MEIIHEGKLPQQNKYMTTCSHCQTVFRFDKNDTFDHASWRNETFVNVRCPLPGCGKTLTVEITDYAR
jgi:hypothetical protein